MLHFVSFFVQVNASKAVRLSCTLDSVHDKSSYYSLLFLCIHTRIHTLDLARLPYYICTLVKSDILVVPVHVGAVLVRFEM